MWSSCLSSNDKYFFNISQHKIYQKIIRKILVKMANRQFKPNQIMNILEKFNDFSYQKSVSFQQFENQDNSKNNAYNQNKHYTHKNQSYNNYNSRNYENQRLIQKSYSKKNVLFNEYENQLPSIFAFLATIVLEMEKKPPKIPILYENVEKSIDLSKYETVYLLSLMALNLVPFQSCRSNGKFNKNTNFHYIFQNEPYKTKCIIEYFIKYFNGKMQFDESKKLTIRRQVQYESIQNLIRSKGKLKMTEVKICSDKASIEEYSDSIKVDFANKSIGGGSLTRGCVQEEIMFANHPELFVSTLLCEFMKDNESIFFIGFKKYFKNIGYGYGTKFGGHEQQTNNYQNRDLITAIDAIQFKFNPIDQFRLDYVKREILKAFIGFNARESQSIVTGNWGCGAFKGNVSLKFMIQWIACSMNGKKMMYCPYGQKQYLQRNKQLLQQLKNQTVESVFKRTIAACSKVNSTNENILQRMRENPYKKQKQYIYTEKQSQSSERQHLQEKTHKRQNKSFLDRLIDFFCPC